MPCKSRSCLVHTALGLCIGGVQEACNEQGSPGVTYQGLQPTSGNVQGLLYSAVDLAKGGLAEGCLKQMCQHLHRRVRLSCCVNIDMRCRG